MEAKKMTYKKSLRKAADMREAWLDAYMLKGRDLSKKEFSEYLEMKKTIVEKTGKSADIVDADVLKVAYGRG